MTSPKKVQLLGWECPKCSYMIKALHPLLIDTSRSCPGCKVVLVGSYKAVRGKETDMTWTKKNGKV